MLTLSLPLTRQRALSAIVAGALVCAVPACGIGRLHTAFADDASITIEQRANEGAVYTMYQVFVADVNEDDVATHIAWNAGNKDAVLAFLDLPAATTGAAQSYSDWLVGKNRDRDGARENAQNAAEYISAMIAASADATEDDGPAAKSSGTFAENFAQALSANGQPASPPTVTSGDPYTNSEGYYLAVSTMESVGTGESGSAPMWIPLGGSMRSIDAKEDAPGLSFQVMEDRAGSGWGAAADANTGQDLAFRVRGTLPGNVDAYDAYHDSYAIALPRGMALSAEDVSSVIVTLNGADVTSQVSVSYADGTLVVEADDLKALVRHSTRYDYEDADGERISSYVPLVEEYPGSDLPYSHEGTRCRYLGEHDVASKIVSPQAQGSGIEISYSAHLNAQAETGEAGNVTTVSRTYTADPVSLAERSAPQRTATVYSYEGQLLKADKSNGDALAGARFTLQASAGAALNKDGSPSAKAPDANTDAASAGLYVQADGSLAAEPYEFETDGNGEFKVVGIDEGVYIVHETAAPSGYEAQDTDIVLTVTSELDQEDGGILALGAQVSGGEAPDVDGDERSRLLSAQKASGIVRIQAVDDRMVGLASTGLAGNGMMFVIAGILAGAGTTGLAVAGRERDGRR